MPVLDFRTDHGFAVKIATGPQAASIVDRLSYHYLTEIVHAPTVSEVSGDVGEGKTYIGGELVDSVLCAVTAADKAYLDQLQQLIQATGLQAGNQ